VVDGAPKIFGRVRWHALIEFGFEAWHGIIDVSFETATDPNGTWGPRKWEN
jgi:hypothetical protein